MRLIGSRQRPDADMSKWRRQRGGEGADNSTKKLAWVLSLVCVYTNTKKNTDKR
jgi:hypothetical protein